MNGVWLSNKQKRYTFVAYVVSRIFYLIHNEMLPSGGTDGHSI
jgi:hypothetical protein